MGEYDTEYFSKIAKLEKMMSMLNINLFPNSDYDYMIIAEELYDIFNDEEKMKRMISILQLKAFW